MNEMEWGAWSVEYNPQSEMYDVFCRKDEETRIHSSWCKKTTAEEVAENLVHFPKLVIVGIKSQHRSICKQVYSQRMEISATYEQEYLHIQIFDR